MLRLHTASVATLPLPYLMWGGGGGHFESVRPGKPSRGTFGSLPKNQILVPKIWFTEYVLKPRYIYFGSGCRWAVNDQEEWPFQVIWDGVFLPPKSLRILRTDWWWRPVRYYMPYHDRRMAIGHVPPIIKPDQGCAVSTYIKRKKVKKNEKERKEMEKRRRTQLSTWQFIFSKAIILPQRLSNCQRNHRKHSTVRLQIDLHILTKSLGQCSFKCYKIKLKDIKIKWIALKKVKAYGNYYENHVRKTGNKFTYRNHALPVLQCTNVIPHRLAQYSIIMAKNPIIQIYTELEGDHEFAKVPYTHCNSYRVLLWRLHSLNVLKSRSYIVLSSMLTSF